MEFAGCGERGGVETAAQPRTAHAQNDPHASFKDGVHTKLRELYRINKNNAYSREGKKM
jgi:hypothetical protein